MIKTQLAMVYRGQEHWQAWDENEFDGPGSPLGFGHSEDDAIADLKEKTEDES